jgi:hypothetical protein
MTAKTAFGFHRLVSCQLFFILEVHGFCVAVVVKF